MTIVEALKIVLGASENGMTSKEAYEEIIKRDLYCFPAKKPDAVVNSTIRRHCLGLDFPTASPIKHFKVVSYKGKKHAMRWWMQKSRILSWIPQKKQVNQSCCQKKKYSFSIKLTYQI